MHAMSAMTATHTHKPIEFARAVKVFVGQIASAIHNSTRLFAGGVRVYVKNMTNKNYQPQIDLIRYSLFPISFLFICFKLFAIICVYIFGRFTIEIVRLMI